MKGLSPSQPLGPNSLKSPRLQVNPFFQLINFVLISLNTSICTIFFQDLGHLPETKIQKFLHEPVNVSRTLQGKEYLPVTQTAQADAISTPPPIEGISYHG